MLVSMLHDITGEQESDHFVALVLPREFIGAGMRTAFIDKDDGGTGRTIRDERQDPKDKDQAQYRCREKAKSTRHQRRPCVGGMALQSPSFNRNTLNLPFEKASCNLAESAAGISR